MTQTDDSEVEQQVMYRLANAPLRHWPFPHLVVDDVFPAHFYARLIASLPPIESYRGIADSGRVATVTADAYRQRHTIDLMRPEPERFPIEQRDFWTGFLDWLIGQRFIMFALQKFSPLVTARFSQNLRDARFHPEFQLVRDFTDYALGPHTDSPHKVAVLLFYLPPMGTTNADLGTSLYVPRDTSFRCDGTRHHARENFLRAATMPWRPNTLVAFFKSARSFHGVEPVTGPGLRRDLIQLSICHRMQAGAFAAVPAD